MSNPPPARPATPVAVPPGFDAPKVRKALPVFRVAAFAVGVGLLLLVLEMVLKYGFDQHWLDWWQIPHGILYMGYLATVANLGFPARWSLGKMAVTALAGVVPFLSFVLERRIADEVAGQLATAEADALPRQAR